MTILFIVESPTKCKAIQKYLGKDYTVIATCGHFMDLDSKTISIDKTSWTPQFIATKQDVIKRLKEANKKCNTIYISTDNDTEGNGIGYHICKVVKGDIYRVTYNEITKHAILEGIENKHRLNMHLVNAYLTRRMIDRIAGYGISPLLWKKFGNNFLSAGRVQSVVLALILQKQNETENNDAPILYDIKADFTDDLSNTIHNNTFEQYSKGVELVNTLTFKSLSWNVDIDIKDKIVKPPPPFITSSIQIACASTFKMSNKNTMDALQKLFEEGLITYHRTSYLNISNQFKKHAKQYIKNNYGDNMYVSRYGCDSNSAHECIRVTNLNTEHDSKIYKLIWKRTVQCLMIPALYDENTITISNQGVQFQTIINMLKEPGYLVVEDKKPDTTKLNIPKKVTLKKAWVEPRSSVKLSYYDEATIIKKMETCGVGRPSTYASTIQHLFYKTYIEYSTNPSRKTTSSIYTRLEDKTSEKEVEIDACTKGNSRMLHVTDMGQNVVMFLHEQCNFMLSTQLTADMESDLDKIENNSVEYKTVLSQFDEKIEKVKAIHIQEQPKKKNNLLYVPTKYGKCIKTNDGKLVNVEGVLKHLKKGVIDEEFVSFIKKLPIQLSDDRYLLAGRYGLYFKDNGNNVKMDYKELQQIRTQFKV